MIINLKIKARQEKYFNSIRYFAHTLPKTIRTRFVSEVSKHNIYLAAQCAMSSEEDYQLEKKLIKNAEDMAANFSNPDLAADGFLALAEFKKHSTILTLLMTIEKPGHLYYLVFQKILGTGDPSIFYQFLKILSQTRHPHLVQYAISSFNGEVHIDQSNREIFNITFKKFLHDKHYGTLRNMVEKYQLYPSYSFILNEPIVKSIEILLRTSNLSALMLANDLVNAHGVRENFPISLVVGKILAIQNPKAILTGIKLSQKNKVDLSKIIDEALGVFFVNLTKGTSPRQIKNQVNALNAFMRKGGAEFLKQKNQFRYHQFSDFINQHSQQNQEEFKKVKKVNENFIAPARVKDKSFEHILTLHQDMWPDIDMNSIKEYMQSVLNTYFYNNEQIPVEKMISLILINFNISFSDLSRVLRKFVFIGIVVEKTDFALYVSCKRIFSDKKLVMPKRRMPASPNLSFGSTNINDLIYFSISAINPKSFSLEIVPRNSQPKSSRIIVE